MRFRSVAMPTQLDPCPCVNDASVCKTKKKTRKPFVGSCHRASGFAEVAENRQGDTQHTFHFKNPLNAVKSSVTYHSMGEFLSNHCSVALFNKHNINKHRFKLFRRFFAIDFYVFFKKKTRSRYNFKNKTIIKLIVPLKQ